MPENAATMLARDLWASWFGSGTGFGGYCAGSLYFGDGETITLEDPATGTPLIAYRDAAENGARDAVAAAVDGFGRWRSLSASERGRILWAIGQDVRAGADPLARLEAIIGGKPIRDARGEVGKVAEMFEYYAGWCDKQHGEVIPTPTTHLTYTLRQPYGVVAQLTPWNAPIFTAGWQLAPALAGGNAVVLKPSELTPFTSVALARIAERAGLPAGVINVLAGLGPTSGQAMVSDPRVRKVVFVGSPETGRRIAETTARGLTPTVLELGGKSANVVFDDANLDRAVGGAAAAIFSAAGQSCVAGSRLLVQRSRHDEVVERLAHKASALKLGQPLDEATEMGPLQNRAQFDQVKRMVDAALAGGAGAVSGGKVAPPEGHEDGFYFAPTVLGGVDNAMPVAREEVFGPVVAAIPFDDEDEAVAIANDSAFGLAGAVWSGDIGRAHRVASRLEAGTVWINAYKTISVMAPFGGFKQSGYGRSSGREGLEEYTQVKTVWTETAEDPAMPFGYG